MEEGTKVYVPVSVAESRISRRFDVIPSGTLYPNADEIAYLQRLVHYKACPFSLLLFGHFVEVLVSLIDYGGFLFSLEEFQDSAILVLNKPPKLPVKVRNYETVFFAVFEC